MKQAPNRIDLIWLLTSDLPQTCVDGNKWLPARPLGLDTIPNRLRLAWMVLTGQADALVWPDPSRLSKKPQPPPGKPEANQR